MEDKYQVININAYLSDSDLLQDVQELLNTFSSPQNEDVEHFLKVNAINFMKKGQSVTYLVFRETDAMEFVGYFTLTVKPISIHSERKLSKKFYQRIERVCKANEEGNYIFSAFLIAQLGKNYSLKKDRQIEGSKLLEIATHTLLDIKEQIGGVVLFLECEDSKNDFLKSFYEKNGFVVFGERISEKNRKLYQLIKPL